MSSKQVQVAIAILYRQGQFLMQLRDNIPGILYPGLWGLFGGHIEPGETPIEALKRELVEEISYALPSASLFGHYPEPHVFRHVFAVPLTVEVSQLVLGEGWDMGLLTPEQIRQGESYSAKAGQVRPLGPAHQRILLDFLEKRSSLV
ncbi:NUDIX hydrolase [Moorena producens PAL-8-15-08-1]|uniref:NUDIX hydrolase n=1 Tax=Moorena producens PAL-8-15-08-1 TaxID=1458985 RepID=A0A1D8TZT0_9CYAN|nr:NUDIX hydrolase [Moorena producens]AOX03074.1 NUDIX hydrolase [Moorena producens PAL-8-15-08-1]